MDIMTAIAAVTQTIDGVRKLREIEKDFDAASFKLQIADLATMLSDAKLALTDVQKQINARDQEIDRLKNALRFHGETVTLGSYRYQRSGLTGQASGMPFCPVCLVDDSVHMHLNLAEGHERGTAFCPRCKAHFTRAQLIPEQTQR